MIDFKRVTVPFALAYLKWAIPCFIGLLVFLLSFPVAGMLNDFHVANLQEQQDAISEKQSELSVLEAELADLRGETTQDVPAYDPNRFEIDRSVGENFINFLFNWSFPDAAAKEAYQLTLKNDYAYADSGAETPMITSFLNDNHMSCSLVSQVNYLNRIAGGTYVYWALCTYELDGEQHQASVYYSVAPSADASSAEAGPVSIVSAQDIWSE